MKVCLFTENHYKGGVDTFIINLVNFWPCVADTLVLACNKSHPGLANIARKTGNRLSFDSYIKVNGINWVNSIRNSNSVFLRKFSLVLLAIIRVLELPLVVPWHILSLVIYFWRNSFDRLIVINGGYPASLLCRCAIIAWRISMGKKPGIFNFHNFATEPKFYSVVTEYIIDFLVHWSSTSIVTVSKECLKSLRIRFHFVDLDKMHYIHNGIADPLENSTAKKKQFNQSSIKYCLMLATYEKRKGHEYLFKAFSFILKEVPDLHLKIFGFGLPEEKSYVQNLVEKYMLSDNVTLNDFAVGVSELFLEASVLVVPSQEYESFGLTLIEAMGHRVPIVATDVGGIPEVIGNSGAGFVCSKNSPQEFAEAIKKIVQDESLGKCLGNNGRAAFEKYFGARIMSKKYYDLLL